MKRKTALAFPALLFSTPIMLAVAENLRFHPNHLTGQRAPYLRRAVSQPVDWYPWGEEEDSFQLEVAE